MLVGAVGVEHNPKIYKSLGLTALQPLPKLQLLIALIALRRLIQLLLLIWPNSGNDAWSILLYLPLFPLVESNDETPVFKAPLLHNPRETF